ncbi:hypothetical protein [Schinkia azotoformans]|uniref:hypothetical protein n=1 Tax=Schinkia azotoformans TaxID=1454 RepID=UPI002DBA86C2|nr:hypothetical protein [Schinkia azotoformans]MEC1744140.1 hypothetical protein [Schinkia azotoformans]
MKFALQMEDGSYARAVAWFTETLPIVTLRVRRIENAMLFNDKNSEEIFQKNYPNSKFVPVSIKAD